MLGSGSGGGARQAWPLAPVPATAEPFSRYGVYSLFPGAGSPAPGLGVGQALYHSQHKVTDALFSSSQYSTFGAPTPPPGSPYSPVPVAQLELLAKGISTSIAAAISNNTAAAMPSCNNNNNSNTPTTPISTKPGKRCCWLKSCGCHKSAMKSLPAGSCSRTNPVEWSSGGAGTNTVTVKREPGAGATPCQVAEVTTSEAPHQVSLVKVEAEEQHPVVSVPASVANGNIPVGIAVARQRLQQDFPSSPGVALSAQGLLAPSTQPLKDMQRIQDMESSGTVGGAVGMAMGGATGSVLQCSDDRAPGFAAWPMGGSSTHATPTLWQYPAPMPVEPMLPLPIPVPPLGYQLVRDPSSGHFLLIPTASLEQLGQAVVWPTYPQPSSHVLLPPPPPLAPLQLLSSTSASADFLATSTTLHQHTQTHSTRLVAVTGPAPPSSMDKVRTKTLPLPLPAHTLIKIEADCTATTMDTGSGGTPHQPFLVYQHPNLILQPPTSLEQQAPTAILPPAPCKSQATSPVACLTPPPEAITSSLATEVQDASNQTEHGEEEIQMETAVVDKRPSSIVTPIPETEAELPPFEPVHPTTPPPVEPSQPEPEVKLETDSSKSDPDISGLELLSNSIVEFENRNESYISPVKYEPTPVAKPTENGDDVLTGIAHMTLKDCDTETPTVAPVDDTLGGLGLLCALAEQRFMEEVEEQRKEKRKTVRCDSKEPKTKRSKQDHDELEREKLSVFRRVVEERGLVPNDPTETNNNCSCRENNKNPVEPSTKNWSPAFMSAVERDMRQELADLQRRCKEKKLELSKLAPSTNKKLPSTPPPQLDKEPSLITLKPTQELLKPPVLRPITPSKEEPSYKRKLSLSPMSTPTTPEKLSVSSSSSKKRKVGRPKKLMATPGQRVATTETIVAKKPRAKAGLVGYILAAKNRLQMQHKAMGYRESSPPRYSEDTMSPAGSPVKTKPAKAGKTSSSTAAISSSRNISSSFSDNQSEHRSKIRPKLQAEATLKSRPEVDSSSSDTSDNEEPEPEPSPTRPHSTVPQIPPDTTSAAVAATPAAAVLTIEPEEDDVEEEEEEENEDEEEEEEEEGEVQEEEPAPEEAAKSEEDVRCILTAQHLAVDKLRVLTAMGGLFYAGHLTAVRAPDVYAITLDGERGNRPHIMSREEILRDAIVEVSPASTTELLPGTRLCAYWSQQYRCLYPGTVAEPGTPDPQLDMRFVCVEFDDGDSGRIALEDIRLLPTDYPIIEYDPNPLLSLSKRRRRTSVNSVTEERRLSNQKSTTTAPTATVTIQEPVKPPSPQAEKENTDINRQIEHDNHRERKRLKKRRKDKLKRLNHDDKKKKRKHRCCDEKCKHRKHHKKHRKHRKHHHSRSEAEENQEVVEVEQPLPVTEEQVEPATEEDFVVEEEDDDEEESVVPKKVENKVKKSKKKKERRESAESRSKMAAFLPARQLWSWSGRGYKRVGVRGRARKQFFKAIQRGKESITVGDCAVFLSTGRPDRPYIGKIEAMWESWGTNMVVKVKWFYHPEETVGCPLNLKYPGALFESPHVDENDVQTISHKCEVLPLKDYTDKLGPEPQRYETIYDNNDIYYLAGYYDPTTTTLSMKPEIPFAN